MLSFVLNPPKVVVSFAVKAVHCTPAVSETLDHGLTPMVKEYRK
jgi:hypothetical protein